MDVVEYLKEKEQILTAELKSKWAPQIRNIQGRISESFESFTQTMPWLSKINGFFDSEQDVSKVSSPKVMDFIEKWSPLVSQETFVGQWIVIDQSRINSFADITGDQQWIHTDELRATTESPFGSTIAHGFLVLSLLPVMTESVNPEKPLYPEARMVVNYGLNSVRFPNPVKNGSRIRARTTLLSLAPAKKSVTVVNKIKVEIEGNQKMACVVEAIIRLYF